MKTCLKFFSGIFPLLLLASCVNDPKNVKQDVPIPSPTGVYILNEGNFGRGNSTLSFYDLQSRKLYNDVFYSVNNKYLGDTGNDIEILNHRAYIVVNNSHKIEIVDVRTHRNIGTINVGAGKSPRQIAFLNDSIALVTNLYDNSVFVINVFSKTVLRRIPVGANPEGIAIVGRKAFVANSGLGNGNTLSIINLNTMTVSQTKIVGDNPVEISVDTEGEVYILCVGFYRNMNDPNDDTPSKIIIVNPNTEEIMDSIFIGGHAFKMALTSDGRGFICGSTSVLLLNTQTNRAMGTFLKGTFYTVGVDESSGDVFLADAKNFIQNGTVYVYSSTALFRTKFDVGINPGSFAFTR